MTKHPSEFPSQSENTWVKVTEKSSCVIWRNGVGETVAFWETGDGEDSSWEIADSTNSASEEKSVGPFETYLDGLEYVNKFIPELGVEELPNKSYPDDKVVEIGSFPHKSGRDCHICEEDIYTCYRVEYGDESVKWFCPKCIAEKFNWDLEKEPTATIDFDSDEHHEGLTKARELL